MIRDRIWYDLVNTHFYMEYLGLHIDNLDKTNRWIDNISMLLSFGSIAGWYKYADNSIFFASILILINGARLMKSKFMTPDSEISALKAAFEFYIDQCRSLENLWYDLKLNRITEEQAYDKFEKFRDSERLMMKINKHNKVIGKEPIQSNADQLTRNYLTKLS